MGITKLAMFELAVRFMTEITKYTKALRKIWVTI